MIGPITQNAERILARTTGAGSKELRISNVELRNIEEKQVKKSRKRREIELNLKKQSQFAKGLNELKYLYER